MAIHCEFISGGILPEQQTTAAVIRNIVTQAANYIELPENVQIVLADLGPEVFAQSHLSARFRRRITCNTRLTVQEIMLPVVHELIHVSQQHTGRLRVTPSGSIIWQAKQYRNLDNLAYEEYRALPWEQEAFAQQHIILKRCLSATI